MSEALARVVFTTGFSRRYTGGVTEFAIAAKTLRKQPAPKEVVLKPVVYDKANFQQYEARAEMRACPTLDPRRRRRSRRFPTRW